MEPAPFSAGNYQRPTGFDSRVDASMEPAPFSAGNWDEEEVEQVEEVASMEPAPFSAGNMPFPICRVSGRKLQWSRRLSAPETGDDRWVRALKPLDASMEPAPFSAGNTGWIIKACCARWCFNGAGAFQRRKLWDSVSMAGTCVASMEPAPFSAGNRRLTGTDATRICRFNGAGAFQRRKRRQRR